MGKAIMRAVRLARTVTFIFSRLEDLSPLKL